MRRELWYADFSRASFYTGYVSKVTQPENGTIFFFLDPKIEYIALCVMCVVILVVPHVRRTPF